MSASVAEPFVLSTYATSQPLHKSETNHKKQRPPAVFATHQKASGSSDGYATVTVQGDGVHVLDVSALHSVISHTLGPSTVFSCPAITRNTTEGTDTICTTYAAIASSADVDAQEAGRTIWSWRDNLSSPLADRTAQKKKSVVITHEISSLLHCPELPTRLLAHSSTIGLTALDLDLNTKATWAPPQHPQTLLRTFVFPRSLCTFVPSGSAPSRGTIVVLTTASEQEMRVLVMSLDESDEFLELGNCSVPLAPQQRIADISCNSSGYISFLTQDGAWHSHRLESINGTSIAVSGVADPFHLKDLLFITKNRSEDVSLLATTSSHVLLSALTDSPTPEIVLLLWDLQFSVLLASHAIPIPSTLLQSKDATIKLTLVAGSNSQALLVLSPHTQKPEAKNRASSHSSVLVVPFSCPPTSTIANAMGLGSAGARWLAQTTTTSTSDDQSSQAHDLTRTKVLTTMRAAMEKNLPQAANIAFFEWEKRESQVAAKTAESAGTSAQQPAFGDSFVRDLLTIVLQPSKAPNTPYSSEIIRVLLNRQLISSTMVEGGLLGALRLKNDWQSIDLALAKVRDLSETEIIECLHFVIAHHRKNEGATTQGTDAMQVDPSTDLPSLPSFLPSCVAYTSTPAALRSAMRFALRDADDIHALVKVLENWTLKWVSHDVKLLPSKKDLKNNEHGIPVLHLRPREDKELPPLEKILDFLQSLLDACFLTILSHAPSHRVLQNIRSCLDPQITYNDELELLRGPLESYARAHYKTIREAGEDKSKKPTEDWRRKRRQAHEQAGLSIGLYRLEELVL